MTTPVISDAQLQALTTEQRAHLALRLAALGTGVAPAAPVAGTPWRRRWLALLAFGGCVALIPWTAMLAATLPDRYVTPHWSTTWVGFDSLLIVSFALTGLATVRRHPARWAAALVTATLLACDAWFDVSTAGTVSDLVGSAITAVAGELPLAAVLIYLAVRGRPAHARAGG